MKNSCATILLLVVGGTVGCGGGSASQPNSDPVPTTPEPSPEEVEADAAELIVEYFPRLIHGSNARRLASLQELAATDRPGRIMVLASALEDDNLPVYIRWNTAEVLGQIDDPRVLDPLMNALEDRADSVRRAAAETLGRIGDPAAIGPLVGALDDDDRHVRQAAYDSVLLLGPTDLEATADALITASAQERWTLAMILADLGESAIPHLTARASHENPAVRRQVIWALGLVGDPTSLDVLIAALGDAEMENRWMAVWALGQLGDWQATPHLVERLEDEDPRVRLWAVDALDRLADPNAQSALQMVLEDPDERVRERAHEALLLPESTTP